VWFLYSLDEDGEEHGYICVHKNTTIRNLF
jgi:hypothetical protein